MTKEFFQLGGCTLYHGDCEEIIKTIPDNSVTLIHTDPLYIEKNEEFFNMAVERITKEYENV